MLNFFSKILALFLALLLSGCISYKPIFDQNQKFISVGEDVANTDFKVCKSKADKYIDQYKLKRTSNEIVRKAVLGSILGGAMGLIFGNTAKSTISGAVGGGLLGGVYGGVSIMSEDKLKPSEMKKNYITQCLTKEGYNIIGWY